MFKTIKVKKEFTFRELLEHIIQNDVSGEFGSCDGEQFRVGKNGTFNFDMFSYGHGETYEVEDEVEIREDMEFGVLIEVTDFSGVYANRRTSIEKVRSEYSKQFYTLIDGELQKIWERE